MRTTLAMALVAMATVAQAATFNPSTGVGSVSAAEVQTAMGWTPAQYQAAVTFYPTPVLSAVERYTITVQYVQNGVPGTQVQTIDVRSSRQVPVIKGAGGYNLPGYNGMTPLNLTRRVPQVGDMHLAGPSPVVGEGGLFPTGQGVRGVITNVALTGQSYRLMMNGAQLW